tara:strand:+ start:3195 stop:4652 length:1458 start_codon:yes stop_codon:yes gene_type:complete
MCDNNMSFEECELRLLRNAVDKLEKQSKKKIIMNPEINRMILILEDFLKKTKRPCYGGTAINNILPKNDQFYDKNIDIPDYDFYSPTPLKDAVNLANIFYRAGFDEVEAKSGVHQGTFKVFVNYIPIADITYLVDEVYKSISKDAIIVNNIYYTPPNFLRMNMYLELSRPQGDVSRWEKVLKRLTLLNKSYPLRGKQCQYEDIQRLFQYGTKNKIIKNKKRFNKKENDEIFLTDIEEKIFVTVKDSLISQGCIFFGAYANRLYLKSLKYLSKENIPNIPDFDVLSDDPLKTATILKERLKAIGIKNIKINKKPSVGEIIAEHYEVSIGPESIVFIYEPLACHSYNTITVNKKNINIATLDTLLSFYLAFLYVKRNYYKANRILCMSEYLFRVQQQNRLTKRGLIKRWGDDCYGEQETLQDIRAKKTELYKKLKHDKNSKEYKWNFLRYIPADYFKNEKKQKRKSKKSKKKRKNKTKKKFLGIITY